MPARHPRRFRRRQTVGQYRIDRLLATGGTAEVYAAQDLELGIRVALKVPFEHLDTDTVQAIRREVRLVARLDHPNILPVRTASEIDGQLVIVQPLGKESLADRLGRRMARTRVLDVATQVLRGLAHAHGRKVAHCDVKPENIILFEDGQVKLGDFGLARFAHGSVIASGSGTVGYMAPEQALGRPSIRSDVFSVGLVLYRMMAGSVPEWPFAWPYPGAARARKGYHRDLVALVQRATEVDSRKRYPSAAPMLREVERLQRRAVLEGATRAVGARTKSRARNSGAKRSGARGAGR